MTVYIICYDISDDKIRNEVFKTLGGYGERRQYSIFECHLTNSQFVRLWKKLEKMIAASDNIICYELSSSCASKAKSLGKGLPILLEKCYYIA